MTNEQRERLARTDIERLKALLHNAKLLTAKALSSPMGCASRYLQKSSDARDAAMWACYEDMPNVLNLLEAILQLCRETSHPGCNPHDHSIAHKILVLCGERPEGKESK